MLRENPVSSGGLKKHTNTLPGQNVRFLNIVTDGTYSHQWTLWDKHRAKRIRHLVLRGAVKKFPEMTCSTVMVGHMTTLT
jgi:hypothetical protein